MFKNEKKGDGKVAMGESPGRKAFKERKEAEYDRNLSRIVAGRDKAEQVGMQKDVQAPSPTKKISHNLVKGTRAVIEISDRGIKTGERTLDFELSPTRAKNLTTIH